MDPGITAALIGAATTAATTAASAIEKTFNSHKPIAGVVENTSTLDLSLIKQGGANHGEWAVIAPDQIEPLATPQVAFDDWKASGDAPESVMGISNVNDLTSAQDLLLKSWIKKNYDAKDSIGAFGLNSTGAGTEGIVVYQDVSRNFAIAFYLDHPASGGIKAGVFVTDNSGMAGTIKKADDYLNNIKNYIWKYETNQDPHSRLSTNGTAQTVTFKGYTVSFGSAEETRFTIKDAG